MDVPMYVERVGSGDPMILLHGFGGSRFTWRYWAPPLSQDHTLHLVDLRGFGAAPASPDGRNGPGEMADDVCALIRTLDLERVTLVGHSMGGGVALLAALRLRDAGDGGRLRRMVSVSGTAYAQNLPPVMSLLERPAARVLSRFIPAPWLIRRVLRSIVYDPTTVTPEQVRGYADPLRTAAAKARLIACVTQLVPDGLEAIVERYPTLDLPVLLLWGRQDPVVSLRSVGERLANDLPRAQLAVLDACGHLPPEEHPEASLALVQAFLAET